MPTIEILGLSKIYKTGFFQNKPRQALRPFHLAVEHGEIFGFLGPNGAGKTTTLKLLMGLIFPTAGTARLLGSDWRDPKIKSRIGFLPEQPYFYDQLTARELLDYYMSLSGIAARERAERVPRMLERVGLGESANVRLRKFSKGMLQRAGIAQAIIHDPEIVFLDEPMSGLDPIGRKEVRDLIQSLKQEGKTVFFSTHILSDAEALCDRVAVMHKGELRGVGVMAELMSQGKGRFEIVWQGVPGISRIQALGAKCTQAGDTVRAEVDDSLVYPALEALRNANVRLISVTPVRASLEEYFIARLDRPMEVSQ